jgi:hypothetical protein
MNKTQNVSEAVINQRVLDMLDRGDSNSLEKVAQAATDLTRTSVREDSFAMKILPPSKATNDMLVRDMTENLSIIEDLEPESPGAKWVALQDVPEGEYIYGTRYRVPFARILTPKFVKDIDELRTHKVDIRKILIQNSIKDGLAEYDGKFIETCESIVFDKDSDGVQNVTGKQQYMTFSGGLTPENWADAQKMLPRGNKRGQFRLRNYIALMNDVTAQDWKKMKVNDIGNENVNKMFNEGLTADTYFGTRCIFTIKDDLVPDNRVWFFAAPEFLGKAYYLTDWTMFMKKEAYFIESFAYWLGGMAIGNIAGVCCADFDVDGSN